MGTGVAGDTPASPFHGAITVGSLLAIFADLPTGVTELACHPGYPDGLESSYADERLTELRALCDPAVRAALLGEGIKRLSFAELSPR